MRKLSERERLGWAGPSNPSKCHSSAIPQNSLWQPLLLTFSIPASISDPVLIQQRTRGWPGHRVLWSLGIRDASAEGNRNPRSRKERPPQKMEAEVWRAGNQSEDPETRN
jgi:hypothetical protein